MPTLASLRAMNYCLPFLFALSLLLPPLAQAQPLDPAAQEKQWDARIEVAKEKQSRGKKMKDAARKQFEAEQKACYKVFQVTDCQRESRLRFNQSSKEAQAIENEGGAEERQVRKERRDDKDARYAAEAPQREKDLREREQAVKADQDAAEAKRNKQLADKAAAAKAGEARRARDAERIKQKQEAHERKVQKRIERAAKSNPPAPPAAE